MYINNAYIQDIPYSHVCAPYHSFWNDYLKIISIIHIICNYYIDSASQLIMSVLGCHHCVLGICTFGI